jgi:hypothetical protein
MIYKYIKRQGFVFYSIDINCQLLQFPKVTKGQNSAQMIDVVTCSWLQIGVISIFTKNRNTEQALIILQRKYTVVAFAHLVPTDALSSNCSIPGRSFGSLARRKVV